MGEGFLIRQKIAWQVGDEDVAEMMWRMMKFKPGDQVEAAPSSVPEDLDPAFMMRAAPSKDTQFFWDGLNTHALRLQKRPDGSLQHPPCQRCGRTRS